MREILFRGKRTDNGEWVYGVPTKDTYDETVIVESIFECDEYNCRGANCLYVDENTIGQYTGLTDRNGKKIFEGDILSHFSNYSGKRVVSIVRFEDGCFMAMADDKAGFCTGDIHDKAEVIGNIHDCKLEDFIK